MLNKYLLEFKRHLYYQIIGNYNEGDSLLRLKQIISASVPNYVKNKTIQSDELKDIQLYARQLIMTVTDFQTLLTTLSQETGEKYLQQSKEYIFSYGPECFSEELTPLVEAMIYNDFKTFKKLINDGANVNECICINNKKMYPLNIAYYLNVNQTLYGNELLKAGADVQKSKLLYQMIEQHHIDMVETLIKNYGCNVNQIDDSGIFAGRPPETPLSMAVRTQKSDMVKKLIELGADTKARTIDIALKNVAVNGNIEILKILLDAGVNINGESPSMSALSIAIIHGQKKMIEALLDAGADINYQNSYLNYTPLMYAINLNKIKIAERLIERGANVLCKTMNNETPLSLIQKKTSSGLGGQYSHLEKIIQAKIQPLLSQTHAR